MQSTYMELDINKVELDKENPRIKMYLEIYPESEVTAEGIALALATSDEGGQTSFVSLKESIRVNEGIINPIIVNHMDGKYIAIEGNTRLQIYKDFYSETKNPIWAKIRAIVYENLSKEQIHSIRLQSHLVGPRDWDPYSKAKYLHYLMYEQLLPIASIISFCGGKKGEINKLVNAYIDMEKYYKDAAKAANRDPDIRDFSKFSELQNKAIIDALKLHQYTKVDFAKWVVNRNINTAQKVRDLPAVLANDEAREEFLKNNISLALEKLAVSKASGNDLDLKTADYCDLARALTFKLDKIEKRESDFLKSDKGAEKRNALLSLRDSINFALDDSDENEEE